MERKLAFGSALRRVRLKRGIAQEQLGASQSFISTIERGIRSPTLEKVLELAHNLNVSPVTLIILSSLEGGQDADALLERVREELEEFGERPGR